MEEQEETRNIENGSGSGQKQVKEENLLQFLDSMDGYLTRLDSLSSTLRQGWLELASARHSMGASRISSVMLDLKVHSAATSLLVAQQDVDSVGSQPSFILRKWVSSDNGECTSGEENSMEVKLQTKSDSQLLRHRNNSKLSENAPARNGIQLMLDDQVQKQRKKSLSVFGGLVSPKLRTAQLSFETALETLVEIANLRSTMLSTFDKVRKDLEGTKG